MCNKYNLCQCGRGYSINEEGDCSTGMVFNHVWYYILFTGFNFKATGSEIILAKQECIEMICVLDFQHVTFA